MLHQGNQMPVVISSPLHSTKGYLLSTGHVLGHVLVPGDPGSVKKRSLAFKNLQPKWRRKPTRKVAAP